MAGTDVRVAHAPPAAGPASRLPTLHTFEAFRSRPFRLLWLNTVSFALVQGIQRFAFVWLVLDMTDGPRAAGLVTFALGIPVVFCALPAGVLSDRMDRRLLIFVSQGAGAVVMAVGAVLVWADAISLGVALALAVAVGATTAFNQPVRQAILPSLVERDRLMNAIVMMTLGMNVTMIVGPALGGASIALWGIGGAFALQAVLYLVGIAVLWGLRIPPVVARTSGTRPLRELRDGLGFVVHHREIGVLVLLLVVSGLLMMGPSGPLIPQIAKEELGRDAFAASMLFAFVGVGMMATSLLLASMGNMANKGGWFIVALIGGGLVFAGIGLSTSYALTAVFMFGWGMGGGIFMNLNQTLIQGNTPPSLMGRVMSIHTMAFMGIAPMGALLAGVMAGVLSAPAWMAICGIALTVFSAGVVVTQPSLRRMT